MVTEVTTLHIKGTAYAVSVGAVYVRMADGTVRVVTGMTHVEGAGYTLTLGGVVS